MIQIKILDLQEKRLLNSLGKIEFWIDRKRSLGSGSIVEVKSNKLIIATAAHCIYDWKSKKFYEKVFFLPYVDNFKIKLTPIKAIVPRLWTEQAIVDYDTGFLVINLNDPNLDYRNFAIPVKFNLPRCLNYLVMGFQNKIIPSKKPLICENKAHPDTYNNSTLQGISSKGKSGMSGGPWITYYEGEYVQNSVSALTFRSIKNKLWGPYWGEEIEAAYLVASIDRLEDYNVVTHQYT